MASPRLLVLTRTTGFRHPSIPDGIAAVRELGATHGVTVDATEDPTTFTPRELERYAAVVFLNTSGTVFNAPQRAAMERFVTAGGGFVGVHAAADTEEDWPFFGHLIGARPHDHTPTRTATLRVTDPTHPATRHLIDGVWTTTDAWYEFHDAPEPHSRVLLATDDDHPIAWTHRMGGGPVFYTALGHGTESYHDPRFRAHLLGGIRSCLGESPTTSGAST
ncbi:ThuA domain-containing protein [Spiractinospora alimapuensis]|uniref:ThuA domain-containing protein n=1 Tax=Spiractinospora alimapuensis TaxID=2820884 RepID=UPI001F3BE78F|nr:ThuA domain-containing protein [Spiractinospora alimapuensis]QVQ52632.1 ThuA domain-containing protein [Spiractinospora alimapuensis]